MCSGGRARLDPAEERQGRRKERGGGKREGLVSELFMCEWVSE